MTTTTKNIERNYSLDLLRIVAAGMVVMIHVSGYGLLNSDPQSSNYLISISFNALVRAAVPLFFMISGSLILNPAYEISLKKILQKIGKIIVLVVLWNIIYYLSTMDNFSFYDLSKYAIKGHFHMWYFEYLIGVYLLIPLFKALVSYKKGSYILYLVSCFIVFGILASTLNLIPFFNEEIRIITGKIHFELTAFSGYFILGYYLSTYNKKINPLVLIFIFLLTTLFYFVVVTNFSIIFSTDSFTLPILIQAITLFLLFKQIHIKTHHHHLKLISSLTLGVYLVHPLILQYIPTIWWKNSLFSIPLGFIAVVSLSFLVIFLLGKLPLIKKWLLSI